MQASTMDECVKVADSDRSRTDSSNTHGHRVVEAYKCSLSGSSPSFKLRNLTLFVGCFVFGALFFHAPHVGDWLTATGQVFQQHPSNVFFLDDSTVSPLKNASGAQFSWNTVSGKQDGSPLSKLMGATEGANTSDRESNGEHNRSATSKSNVTRGPANKQKIVERNQTSSQVSSMSTGNEGKDKNGANYLYKNRGSRNSSAHYITVDFTGRLGNIMFEYAALYCLARENGLVPLIKESDEIHRIFPQLDCEIQPSVIVTNLRNVTVHGERFSMKYDERTTELHKYNTHVHIGLYFQSWKYCNSYKEEVKEQFVFSPSIEQKVHTFLKSLLTIHGVGNGSLRYIGMHIRRGDFLTTAKQKLGHIVVDNRYITKTIEYFSKQFPNAIIVVCTDDKPWAETNLKSREGSVPIVFSPFTTPAEDMCLLSKCNHTIMTTGTFGWWAAWLAGGQAVYVEEFPDPNTRLGRVCNREDYYLPHWTPIKAFS